MKPQARWTVLAVVPFLWLLVACNDLGTTSVATPGGIPTPMTTPTRSDPPTPFNPTTPPTQPATAAQVSPTIKPTTAATISISSAANAPRVISFTVVPTTTQRLGDKITATWQARGTRATLCPTVLGWGSAPEEVTQACSEVPLAGTKSITVDDKALTWSGMMLRVTTGETFDRSWVQITVGCQGLRDWEFPNGPAACPQAAATHSPGAAQHFEHGLMVWIKEPDTFFILYGTDQQSSLDLEWISAPYRFRPGASPNNRVGETPPRGRYEPVSGFGQLWRGEFEGVQNVRQRLGWATEQEFSFTASYQCAIQLHPKIWVCYLGLPDGQVLAHHPDSSAGVRLIWRVIR